MSIQQIQMNTKRNVTRLILGVLLAALMIAPACKSGDVKNTTEEVNESLSEFETFTRIDEDKGTRINEVKDENGKVIAAGPLKSRLLFELLPRRADEDFRVYISSDEYIVRQMRHEETIQRKDDKGGDSFICDELKPYNKIDFSDEAAIEINLNPHTGNMNRVSVDQVARVRKITSLLKDDSTRWQFEFPKTVIRPQKFKIYYFLALYGKQSRDQIKEFLKTRVLSY